VYLYVDESGNHSQKDCYTVAACWCVSEYDTPAEILKPTTRRLKATVLGDEERGELKGEEIDTSTLRSIFWRIPDIVTDDATVDIYNLPWGRDQPVGYTIYDADSDLGKKVSENYLGETRSGTTPQLLALVSLVSLLLRMEGPDHAPIESRHVILDATTWENPRFKLRGFLDGIDWAPEIHLETRRSHTTPGIQLADLAAHFRRQYLVDGTIEYTGLNRSTLGKREPKEGAGGTHHQPTPPGPSR
jgi:hypothetical protein